MNPIATIISGLTTLFTWFKERAKETHDLKIAEIRAKKQIVLSKDMANSEWEIAQLLDKDKLLRWAAFLLFASPLIASLVSPTWGAWVQRAWHSLEPWEANVLSGMCLAVFGLKKIPQLVGNTVGAVVDAIKKPKLPPPRDTDEE